MAPPRNEDTRSRPTARLEGTRNRTALTISRTAMNVNRPPANPIAPSSSITGGTWTSFAPALPISMSPMRTMRSVPAFLRFRLAGELSVCISSLLSTLARRRWQGRQARQLLRVAHDVDAAHPPFNNVQGDDAVRAPLEIIDDAGQPVDLHQAPDAVLRHEFPGGAHDETRHVQRTVDRVRHRGRLATSVGVEHDVAGEKRQETLQVSARGGVEELLEHFLALLHGGAEARPVLRDVLARPPKDLPAVRFALMDHLRDLRVLVLENLPQKEHGALDGRQPLQEEQERHRQRLADPGRFRGVAGRHGQQRLGKPRADVLLALDTRRLQMVQTQPADDGDQERPGIADVGLRGLLPADE